MLPGVFAQIPLNLQKPFTLWNETTYYFFKVICRISRSRGPKKIIMKQVKFGVSRHFVENTQEEWLEILHAGVVWPPSKLIDFGHGLFICLILTLSWLVKQVRFAVSIQAFSGECMGGMAWNLACWYIQSTSRIDYIMIMVYWFYSFWWYFDLVKQVKFAVSGQVKFERSGIMHWKNDLKFDMLMYPDHLLTSFWSSFVDFPCFDGILTQWNGSNLLFLSIFRITHSKKGLKFDLLVHLDRLQNWLDFSHGLLIFLFLLCPLHGSMPIWLAFGDLGVPQLLDP